MTFGDSVAGTVEEAYDRLRADPLEEVCRTLIGIGTVAALAGAFLWAISGTMLAQAQASRNDADSILGVPQTTLSSSATPPAPPAPSANQTLIAQIASTILNLSQTDAPGNANATAGILQSLLTLQANLAASSAPPATQDSAASAVNSLIQLINDFGFVPASFLAFAQAEVTFWTSQGDATNLAFWQAVVTRAGQQTATSPAPGSTNWTQANNDAVALLPFINELAVVLNVNPPFLTGSSGTASPPSTPNPLQIYENTLIATATGGLAGFVINSATGGLTSNAGGALNRTLGYAGQVAGSIGSGLSSLVGDVEKALQEFAAGIMNLPQLLADAAVGGTTWLIGTIGQAFGPMLLAIGVGMAVLGLGMRWARKHVAPRIEAWADSKLAQAILVPLDKELGTGKNVIAAEVAQERSSVVETAVQDPEPVAPLPPAPAVALATPPSPTPGPTGADVGNGGIAVDEAGAVRKTVPAEAEKPTPEPTERVENELGVSYTEAKDRMRAALWKRDHPEPPAPPPPEPEPSFEAEIAEQGEAEQETAEDEMRRALEARDEMAVA